MFEDVNRFRTSEATAVDAARVGEELRDARLSYGWSIEDIAAQLRIRRTYLVALEEGRVHDLPSPAYAIGFVRSYSGLLGLDADDIVRRFRDAATGVAARRSDLVFPEPVPERGFPTGVVLLLGAVLAVGSYIGWYSWSGSGTRTVDAVPPVPARLEPAVRDGEPLRPPSSVARAPAAVSADEGEAPAPAPSTLAANPGPGLPPIPVPTTVPVQVPPPPPPVVATPAPPPPPAVPQIVLRFRGDAWTQVRDPQANRLLLSRVMRAGERWEVPNQEGLLLSTGAGQNMDIYVNGALSPMSEQIRGVRRNFLIDPVELAAPPPTPE